MDIEEIKQVCTAVKKNIQKVIIGKDEVIDLLLSAIIAGGNVLLEDVPGTGKTVIAKSMAKSFGIDFKRIQFTPDLLPSDLTGINYYNQKLGEFVLRKGPVFTNILLADELNRATPRTQSSLLECMEEKQVTIDGVTHELGEPFFVIATQNPIETYGTYPLPEAQLDRFLFKITMGYPTIEEGEEIFNRFISNNPLTELNSVCTIQQVQEMRRTFVNVYVSSDIMKYILKIVEKTRENSAIKLGVSPRGSLAVLRACQAYAALKGREFVTPDDVKFISPFVLQHRIITEREAYGDGMKNASILQNIINGVEVPTENWGDRK